MADYHHPAAPFSSSFVSTATDNQYNSSTDTPWYSQPSTLVAILAVLITYLLYSKFFGSQNSSSSQNNTASNSDSSNIDLNPKKKNMQSNGSNSSKLQGKTFYNSNMSTGSTIIIKGKLEQTYSGPPPENTPGHTNYINHNAHKESLVEMNDHIQRVNDPAATANKGKQNRSKFQKKQQK